MKSRIDNGIYFITLSKGDYINKSFEYMAKENNISSAWISGIGACENPEVGYYSLNEKNYYRKIFKGEYEIISLNANISIKDGNIFSHAHISFSDSDYRVYGGHLFDAKIIAAGEFVMFVGQKPIVRQLDKDIGLFLWCLEDKS